MWHEIQRQNRFPDKSGCRDQPSLCNPQLRQCDSKTLALCIHVYLLSLKHPSHLAGLCLSLLEPSSGLVEVLTADESQ